MKIALRSQKLLERLEHQPLEKERKDFLISQKIAELSEFRKAQTILFYAAIRGEVHLNKLFELFKDEKRFLLPKVRKDQLDLYYVENLENLEKGSFEILEPKEHFSRAEFEHVDIALIPGIVFSRNGHRIGYGKGFYDRMLTQMNCLKIGIAYDFQMVENIPGETHDVAMDLIITEKEIIRI